MKNILLKIRKALTPLFSTRSAGLYFILFAASIGIATFIENDYGTSSAQKVIFKSWWFELLLLLFAITIIVNIIRFRMIQQKKWAVLMFHASVIIILIGAGLTRYLGFEGIMHIRENASANSFLSSDTFLKFKVEKAGTTYDFSEPVLFATLGNNNWKESFLIGNDLIEVKVKDFVPNPKQTLETDINGKPILKLVVSGANGREEYYFSEGQTNRIGSVVYNFTDALLPDAVNFKYRNDSLLFSTNKTVVQRIMAIQQTDTIYPTGDYNPLMLQSLYTDGLNNFVVSEFNPKGKLQLKSNDPKVKSQSNTALLLDVAVNGNTKETIVYGSKGFPGNPQPLNFENLNVLISYGAKEITVPFSIKLNEFILDKYPGTNSASSYASEVTLVDSEANVNMDYRIFMNNILDYDGYRFFQSSFDKDEKGTYLSVNSDFWGTVVSYLGYILLTLGMILTLFSKKTRFYDVVQKIKKLRRKSATFVFLLFLLASFSSSAQTDAHPANVVSFEHAEAFSTVVVQDFKGRMKPVHTLSREVLRKIYRKEHYNGLTADQVMLACLLIRPIGMEQRL